VHCPNRLIALVLGVLCLGASSCGGAGDSNATSRDRASSHPRQRSDIVDYDIDDYDSKQRNDGDNDFDSRGGGLYDGDDGEVTRFGRKATPEEMSLVGAAVKRYFAAAVANDASKACSMIAPLLVKNVVKDLSRRTGPPYGHSRTCAELMSKVFKRFHAQLARYADSLSVIDLRLNRGAGPLVFGAKGLPVRQILVVREGGVWKMNALLDSELL
jgi:hypothetical protein